MIIFKELRFFSFLYFYFGFSFYGIYLVLPCGIKVLKCQAVPAP